jgi:ubiquinone/menaquinone biosynthesis C-methylase UbiE
MTVMDLGCGAGFASIGLAKLVGQKGLVISADLQPEMLDMVSERAQRSGLSDRIRIHQCQPDRIGIYEQLDFVVAFWMVHEVPDREGLAQEIHTVLRPEGRYFVAEPKMHVSREDFETTIREAQNTGFAVLERPCVRFSRTAVLSRLA